MSYIVLIIVILLFLIVSIKRNKDILRPQFVYAFSMLLCLLCAIIGLFFWNDIKELKILTIVIILVSFFSFTLGCVLCENIVKKYLHIFKKNILMKKKYNKFFKLRKAQKYDLNLYFIIFEITFILLTIILMYQEVRRIAFMAGYDGNGFGNMINKYRELSILYTTELVENGRGVNIIVSQMKKICEVLCTFNIFMISREIMEKKLKNYKVFLYLLIVFLCFFLSVFTGGRMQLFIYIISFLFFYLFFNYEEFSSLDFIKKNIKKIIIICLLLVVGFYGLLPLSGRNTKTNIVSYMSFYFGTSIPSLDKYNSMNHDKPKYFGEETLRGINTVLYKFNLTNNISPISKEWVSFKDIDNSNLSSNIFTSAKRYYHDFGFIGIFLCQFIFGFVFAFIYILAKNSNFILVFYSMYFYMCIDQVRDELFFSDFIHINMLFKFVVLLLLFLELSVIEKGKMKYEK